jgi:dihydroorotase
MKLLIKNGRVVDPSAGLDETLDLLVVDGRIEDMGPKLATEGCRVIDASRLSVVPGLIDLHVHLRQPGFEEKETIATGGRAAARGGFTTVCPMPNTNPVNDSPAVTESILAEARRSSPVNILPIAAVTLGSRGEELTDMAGLLKAGAVAFSDDGRPVANSRIMRRAMEEARALRSFIIDHCEDLKLAGDGVMNEGPAAERFGLKGIPAAAEAVAVARDIVLAAATGARVHIAHISTAAAVEAVREAKKRGVPVTAEATPHHLTLSEESLATHDANFKMNPPLRSKADVETVLAAVADGTIDSIATDHAPHTEAEKARGINKAPFGVVGLETAVPVVLDRLVHRRVITLGRMVELMSGNPARILGLSGKGRIAVGCDADLTFLNLAKETVIDRSRFESKGRNTPFEGWKLRGAVAMTMVGGRLVYPFGDETAFARS